VSVRFLVDEFRRVEDAPDAINELRRVALALALRGGLTGNAREGMQNEAVNHSAIHRGMNALLRTRPKYRWEVKGAEPSHTSSSLPQGWCETELGNTGLFINGLAFKASDWGKEGRPIIRIQNLSGMSSEYNFTSGEYSDGHVARQGDLLVSWSATLDAFVWDGPEGIVNQHIFKVIPNEEAVTREYLYWLLKHEVRQLSRGQHAHGLAMMHINRGPFLSHRIILPTLAEQNRIVGRLNEFMSLCAQIEANRQSREQTREALRTASLERLTLGIGDGRTRADMESLLDGSARAITKSEHVADVRRTVLELAVRGMLVPQDPGDQPVRESLLVSDHARVETATRDRRASPQSQELLASELCWETPSTWQWRGMADLALFIDYRGKTPTKTNRGVRLVTAKNVRQGHINVAPEEFISEEEYSSWMTRGLPTIGDVLFTTEAPMGNAAVVRIADRFALAQRVIAFRLYGSVCPEFFALQIESLPFQRILDASATGLTAKGIKAAKLKRLPVAVPPLPEQRRIVAKVDELMTVCDSLEAAMSSVQSERSRLLQSLVQRALGEGTAS